MAVESSPAGSPRSPDERLDSWKAIATYLDRGIRTVQRWEQVAALPVRRLEHEKGGTVYAYKAELDAWWAGRSDRFAGRKRRWRRVLYAALAGAAALVLVAVPAWLTRQLDAGRVASRVGNAVSFDERVWAGPELSFTTSFDTDGRHIVYVDWSTGDVKAIEIATGKSWPLTRSGSWFHPTSPKGYAQTPELSPDGTQVSFAWFEDEAAGDLRLTDLHGSAARVLVSQPHAWFHPLQWSADGSRILAERLARPGGEYSIVLISTQDGSLRTLVDLGRTVPRGVSLSPDGRYVAYTRTGSEPSQRDIFVTDVADARERPLVVHPADDLAPMWAPDGRHLVFSSTRGGVMGLWALEVIDGRAQGPARLLKADATRNWPIRFGPDGFYYYSVIKNRSDVYLADLDPVSGRVASPPREAVPELLGLIGAGDWSPDGTRLALVLQSGAYDSTGMPVGSQTSSLMVLTMADGSTEELTAPSPLFGVRWSPSGDLLAGPGRGPDGEQGIVLFDLRTSATRFWFGLDEPLRQFEWLPDGEGLLYRTGRTIHARRVGSTRSEPVHSPADAFAISPDGLQLVTAVHDTDSGLVSMQVVPLAEGSPRELVRLDLPEWISALAWSPAGDHVFFAKGDRRTPSYGELWRVPVMGGRPVSLGVRCGQITRLRVHPDGRRLAFHALRIDGEIRRMTNPLVAGRR